MREEQCATKKGSAMKRQWVVKLKYYGKNLLIGILIVLVPLLATEAVAIFLFPKYADNKNFARMVSGRVINAGYVQDDPSKGFWGIKRYSPNKEETMILKGDEVEWTVRTNSLGFRSKELQPKQANEYRVLILGDSMFFGNGVNQSETISSYLEIMGNDLPRENNKTVSVYDYSISGLNTVSELLIFRNFVREVNPDHVVLGFFYGNDILPNALATIDEFGNYFTPEERLTRFRKYLIENYKIFSFNSILIRAIAHKVYPPRVRFQVSSRPEIINKTYGLLKKFQDESQELGIHFSVVIIHPKDSIQGGILQAWTESSKIGKLVFDFCQKSEIDVIDMSEFMKGKEDREKYFYRIDGHYTKQGTSFVAKVILNETIKNHL